MAKKRVGIGGFMLESNNHSPVAMRAEFEANVLLEGAAMLADLRTAEPRSPVCLQGFYDAMNKAGDWEPVPLLVTSAGASGPVDQEFFDYVMARTEALLKEAGKLDAVFLSQHGAASATREIDPDGKMFAMVRRIVGPGVPILATLDLHANVSRLMVDSTDVLVSYLCNPHTDMAERGVESAEILHRMFRGLKTHAAFVKLPLIPPSTSLNTKAGPYADLIGYGQSKKGPGIVNVSVVSGFSLGDTPKNGMSIVVTAENKAQATALARDIAERAWGMRQRFVTRLTPLDKAIELALSRTRDASLPSLIFADVADNPGGGGRGNTTFILEAFHKAGVQGAALGPFYDPALAREAVERGVGAEFEARFNRDERQEFSKPYAAKARVLAVSDGRCVARRGIQAGRTLDLGTSCALDLGGIVVTVISNRHQGHDPIFFELFGIDLRKLRCLILKSRGHFRAAFDDIFSDDRIVEVDVPGLTTPVLTRFPYRQAPRPIFPLDPDMQWSLPAA
jgi:microcystin degradation protein MlrC